MQTLSRGLEAPTSLYLKETLAGALYPIAKSDVIELAASNRADDDLLQVLYALGDSNYYCLSDIKQEIQYLVEDDMIDDDNRFVRHYHNIDGEYKDDTDEAY